MLVSLKVRGVGAFKHELGRFILTILNIPNIDEKSREVYTSITYKLHLVDRLKTNILVGNNMLYTEGFAVNLYNSFVLIHNYSVKIDINTRQQLEFLRLRALVNASTIIPSHLEVLVAFQYIKLPDSHDFLLSPAPQQHLTLYFHLLDHISTKVFVYNNIGHA